MRVSDILEMLAENLSPAEILENFPDLESEDIQACADYKPFFITIG
ncbi:DUF433 domain-containing protein [Nostoc sp.]